MAGISTLYKIPIDPKIAFTERNYTPDFTQTRAICDELRVRVSLPPGAKLKNVFYLDPDNILLSPLQNTDGFIFPIQPAMQTGFEAAYQKVSVTHGNFDYYHFTNSSMKALTVTGDFLVRNEYDARYVQAGMLFLKSLTRMFNYKDTYADYAGAPPQVVRLHGMGFNGFDNIPVVISDVSINYPDSVDYISFKKTPQSNDTEIAKLPVNFSITVSMNPVFSRDFISQQYSTWGYSKGQVRLLGGSGNEMLVTPSSSISTTSIQTGTAGRSFEDVKKAVKNATLKNPATSVFQQINVKAKKL